MSLRAMSIAPPPCAHSQRPSTASCSSLAETRLRRPGGTRLRRLARRVRRQARLASSPVQTAVAGTRVHECAGQRMAYLEHRLLLLGGGQIKSLCASTPAAVSYDEAPLRAY
eukprot:2923546-Pleurochrysis_carterae.AAC.2